MLKNTKLVDYLMESAKGIHFISLALCASSPHDSVEGMRGEQWLVVAEKQLDKVDTIKKELINQSGLSVQHTKMNSVLRELILSVKEKWYGFEWMVNKGSK